MQFLHVCDVRQVSSNCCMFDETSDGGVSMAAMVNAYSFTFSIMYLL